jgi:hypothetical protein
LHYKACAAKAIMNTETLGGETFVRVSRFHTVGLVVDLHDKRALPLIAGPEIVNTDAREAISGARKLGARFVVVAGQLHRKKAGAFTVFLMTEDADALCQACVMAHMRLTDLGETYSQWFICVDAALRERVKAALAHVTASEGNA